MIFHNWQKARIKDIGRVITGRTPPTEVSSYFGNKYPFITPSDMREEKNIYEAERGLSAQGATLLMNNRIPPNSIAVSCIGWQMGKVAMISSVAFTNQQINTIIPTNQYVDPNFIYYSLCTRRKELQNLASVGTRTPILKKSGFENIEIYFPPLSTQRTIASILSAYDNLIENNARRIAILEEIAQMIYEEWFVRFRFPGHEQVEMVESEVGMIPEGWVAAKLGDIAIEQRRSINPESVDPETPYFGLEHLPRKSIALADWGTAKTVQSTKLVFKRGDILFGKIRPYLHKVGVAPLDGVCSSDTIIIGSKQSQHKSLLLSCVSSDNFVAFASKTSQGTQMPRANWTVLATFIITIPPPKLLSLFNNFVESAVDSIINIIFRNRNLRRTRDLLLPKLISGEIDVSSWVQGDAQEIAQELAASAVGTTNGYGLHTEIRKVAEAGPIEPMEKDALEWHSLWE